MIDKGGPKQQQINPSRLDTKPAIAIPLVRVDEPLPARMVGKGAGAGAANSGKEPSGRQSVLPSILS